MILSVERKRIVIVGADGRLGGYLSRILRSYHQVVSLNRGDLDLSLSASICRALLKLEYDMVIITGGLTAVDYCETHSDEAFRVNAEGPAEIARISATKGAHVTYFSTDFVFDGEKASPYTENDAANPQSVYGASKLLGELHVTETSADNLVIRVSWLFGPGKPAFPEWIISKACNEVSLSLPEDKIASPTSTIDLAHWTVSLLFGESGQPYSGLFHLCNSQPCSWREWGEFCINTARNSGLSIPEREVIGVPLASVDAFVAKRPLNSVLSTEKFTHVTGISPRKWHDATRSFLESSSLFNEMPPFSKLRY